MKANLFEEENTITLKSIDRADKKPKRDGEYRLDELVSYLLSYRGNVFALVCDAQQNEDKTQNEIYAVKPESTVSLDPITVDFVTVRSVVRWVCDMKSTHMTDSPYTVKKFFEQLILNLYNDDDIGKQSVLRWCKLCSEEIPTKKTLSEMFSIFDDENSTTVIKHNLKDIMNSVDLQQGTADAIIEGLKTRRRFYKQSEFVKLIKALSDGEINGDYSEAVFLMLKHGCDNIDISSGIITDQLFEYANCSEYQSNSWYVNVVIAAELGDPKAAHEIGRELTQWKYLSSGATEADKERIRIALDLYKRHTNYTPILFEIVWLLWNGHINCDSELRQSVGATKKTRSIIRHKADYLVFEKLRKYMTKEDQLAFDLSFFLTERDFYRATYIIIDIIYKYRTSWGKAGLDCKVVEQVVDRLLLLGVAHNETRSMLVLSCRLAERIDTGEICKDDSDYEYNIALFWELSKMSAFPYRDDETREAIVQYWQALVLEKTEPDKTEQILALLKQAITRINSIMETQEDLNTENNKKLEKLKNDAEDRAKRILFTSYID